MTLTIKHQQSENTLITKNHNSTQMNRQQLDALSFETHSYAPTL